MYEHRAASDLTSIFKSCIKTVKIKNASLGCKDPPNNILNISKKSEFMSKAQDIQSNIYHHQKLLKEHKMKYVKDDSTSFSLNEKLYMEKVINTNLKIIDDDIRTLENSTHEETDEDLKTQAHQFRQNVVNCLRSNYLHTSSVFRDMKDLRIKRQKQKERLLSLHCPPQLRKKPKITEEPVYQMDSDRKRLNSGNDISEKVESEPPRRSYIEDETQEMLNQLSEDDLKQLEQENKHLHKQLLSSKDEIKQITSQVVELSQMQDILTENVEIQSKQIDDIHNTILSSTDNVQRGNEEVREAMRRDAGFRVWVMFFIIVMSITIIFLDWFNQ